MNQIRHRLLGLVATLGLVAWVVGVPILLLVIHATPSGVAFTTSRLMGPDDGTLLLAITRIVVWIAWATSVALLVLEVVAQIRRAPAPSLRGLRTAQFGIHRVVALSALLFVAAPTISGHSAETHPALSPVLFAPAAQISTSTTPAPVTTQVEQGPVAEPVQTVPYVVRRGDSLWKIAQEHLGDPTRYTELVNLNRATLDGRADFLRPGTVLQLPKPAEESTYVVQPGDTLSGIAESELGDASDYPQIYDASRSLTQPDGAHLTSPDLIKPGWTLEIPDKGVSLRPPSPPAPTRPMPKPDTTVANSAPQPTAAVAAAGHESPSWLLPGLTAGGAVLAGGLFLAVRNARRTQLRYRRPGHLISPPPDDLREVERSIRSSGSITAPKVEALDAALRHLSPQLTDTASVHGVRLDTEQLEVQLTEPAELSTPWTGTGTSWAIALDAVPEPSDRAIAPFPMLACVGTNDHGGWTFLNLDLASPITISGDASRAADLARHLVAELAVNPWATLVETHLCGIGDELVPLDPLRIQQIAESDLDRLVSEIEAEDDVEPDRLHCVVLTTEAPETSDAVADRLQSRPSVATITLRPEPDNATTQVTTNQLYVSADGRLTSTTLGLNLAAAGLRTAEASRCAELVSFLRQVPSTDHPGSSDEIVSADGALASAYTTTRPDIGPAGDRSLLPLATTDYTRTAATTCDDVSLLAPTVSAEAERTVMDRDPDLDRDVARWQSPALLGPKLTLLGKVTARTLGDAHQMAGRRDYYFEILAYLALHPRGVTAGQAAAALGISADRARKDLSILRGWLGTDPRTNTPHLPSGQRRYGPGEAATYQVHGLLCDWDLFTRLRTRGQTRGADGISDLITALDLVTGEPFTELRAGGWGWLDHEERTDHIATCAVADVAHIVTTHAVTTGDLALARSAAATGMRAAPYDETANLDWALVEDTEAGGRAAHLDAHVFNRSDDQGGPIDLPPRSVAILADKSWVPPRHTVTR